jgi:hypothetical protein
MSWSPGHACDSRLMEPDSGGLLHYLAVETVDGCNQRNVFGADLDPAALHVATTVDFAISHHGH